MRLAERLPSVSPNSRRRAGLRSMTSSVCWPMEPVAPSIATLTGRVMSVDQMEHGHVEVDEDRWKEDRVEAVEDASVTRDQVGRILDLCDSLHLRLDEVSNQRADSNENADDRSEEHTSELQSRSDLV